jgi:hypothetical protein
MDTSANFNSTVRQQKTAKFLKFMLTYIFLGLRPLKHKIFSIMTDCCQIEWIRDLVTSQATIQATIK